MISTLRIPIPSFSHRTSSLCSSTSLFARPTIGDVVVAEVDDIMGTVDEPIVKLKVRDGNDIYSAILPARSLSPVERLAFQTGSVVRVHVSGVEGKNLRVGLKPSVPSNVKQESAVRSPRPVESTGSLIHSQSSQLSHKEERLPHKPNFKTLAATKTPQPPPGLLLNNIKTGMELKGIVQSCVGYAAFIDLQIFRNGRGGAFRPVNGMLHRDDIPKNAAFLTKERKQENRKSKNSGVVIEEGSEITVYVKDVLKNAGRFTVTLDPTINKDKVVEKKLETKTEGLARRRSRRVRRVLDEVVVGDTVQGVVKGVVGDGILVTLTSLGPLNITGLVSKKDLPPQFQVPPDLKDSFQLQLLRQDFVAGREITCSVEKVNTRWTESTVFNVNLLFDELGRLPVGVDDIDLSGITSIDSMRTKKTTTPTTSSQSKDDEGGDDVDDESEEDDETDDVRDIYNELRGSSKILPVADLKAWGDLQDMITDGDVTMAVVDKAIRQSGAKNNQLTFEQFSEFVALLQDEMDETADQLDDGEVIDTVADAQEVQTAFDELRGKRSKVLVADLSLWVDLREMIDNDEISAEAVDAAIKKVAGKNKELDFEQFSEFVDIVQEGIDATPLDDEDNYGEDDDGVASGAISNVVNTDISGGSKVIAVDDADADGSDEELQSDDISSEDDALTEDEVREQAKELFDELSKGKDTVTVKAFLSSGFIEELIDEEVIDKDTLQLLIAETGVKKTGSLTEDQLAEVMLMINDYADEMGIGDDGYEGSEDDDDEYDGDYEEEEEEDDEKIVDTSAKVTAIEDNDDSEEGDGYGEEDDLSAEEMEEMMRETFDELKSPKTGKLSVKKFLAWDTIQESLVDESLSQEVVDTIIKKVCGDAKDLSFEQFLECMNELEEAVADADDDGDVTDSSEDEATDEELEAEYKELFDELKSKKSGKVAVDVFLKWDGVQGLIEDEEITAAGVKEVLAGLGVGKDMDFTQFKDAFNAIEKVVEEDDEGGEYEDEGDDVDEATIEEDGDDAVDEAQLEAEYAALFDELKSKKTKKVAVSSFLGWSNVKELVDEDYLTTDEVKELLTEIGITKDMDFSQFKNAIKAVESAVEEEGDEDGDEDEDEISDEDWEKIKREDFDELASKKTGKVSVKDFLKWEAISEEVEAGAFTEKEARTIIASVIGEKGKDLTYEQFDEVLAKMEELVDVEEDEDDYEVGPIDDTESEGAAMAVDDSGNDGAIVTDEEGDEDDEGPDLADLTEEEIEEMLKGVFDNMKDSKTGKLAVTDFKGWGTIQDGFDNGDFTESTFKNILKKVGVTKDMTYDQFIECLDLLEDEINGGEEDEEDEQPQSKAAAKQSTQAPPAPTPIPTMTPSAQAAIARGMQSAAFDLSASLSSPAPTPVTIATPGKGFAKPPPEPKGKNKGKGKAKMDSDADAEVDDADEIARIIFNELRGKRATLRVDDFKNWEDTQEMIESGALKRSVLEKALAKVGALETGELNLQQFGQLIDIIQKGVDDKNLKYELLDDDQSSGSSKGRDTASTVGTSKQLKVMSVQADDEDDEGLGNDEDGDDDDEYDEDDEDEDGIDEEEATQMLFDELRGKDASLSLVKFIQWEDVQELLESGALTKDNLAFAIEKCGVSVDQGELSFETFYDLVQIIDEFVDKEKLDQINSDIVMEQRLQVDGPKKASKVFELVDKLIDNSEGDEEGSDAALKMAYVTGDARYEGDEALEALETDLEDEEIREEESDVEVEEMFEELSKGKGYITEKALRKWDELKELIEADFIDKKSVDTYIERLQIAADGKIDFEMFQRFMGMLDRILLDDEGNLLGADDEDRAVVFDDEDEAPSSKPKNSSGGGGGFGGGPAGSGSGKSKKR